jgi:hypothetical protein
MASTLNHRVGGSSPSQPTYNRRSHAYLVFLIFLFSFRATFVPLLFTMPHGFHLMWLGIVHLDGLPL